jgi:hypothetical protein
MYVQYVCSISMCTRTYMMVHTCSCMCTRQVQVCVPVLEDCTRYPVPGTRQVLPGTTYCITGFKSYQVQGTVRLRELILKLGAENTEPQVFQFEPKSVLESRNFLDF